MDPSESWSARTTPVLRQSATEMVFEEIRNAIESGELPVGTKLPSEAALGERFGVSRVVIREALRSCQAIGLTETRTGSGTYVVSRFAPTELTFGDVSSRDLIEARPAIEVPAAGFAADRRTDADVDKLTALVDAMERERDAAAWVRLDAELHTVIARASKNAVYAKVIEDIRDALATQSEVLNLVGRRQSVSNREHRRIVRAISRGDRSGAEESMRVHLANVEQALQKVVDTTSE